MPEAEIAKAVQLLDLMLEHFADDDHWTRGRYDDGNGGHCLVGALLHLSRKHHLPRAPAIALLQDAMPRPGLPLVHFNDSCCGSVAELRSIILKARRLADNHAERERATAAVKTWLLAQIEQKRAAPASDIVETASGEPLVLERLASRERPQQPAMLLRRCQYTFAPPYPRISEESGRRFPTCRHCKGIRFELAHAAKHVGEIDHLEEAHAQAG